MKEKRVRCCNDAKSRELQRSEAPNARSTEMESNFTVDRRKIEKMEPVEAAAELRSHFIQLLRSRRSPEVPLEVLPAKPVLEHLYQGTAPVIPSEVMEPCPKVDTPNLKELLKEEKFYLTTEEGDQGRLPVVILSMKENKHSKRPAVVFLHGSNMCKEWLRPLLEDYASRGYIAVAIDSRYHGERAKNHTTYVDALVSSWKRGDTMPFIYDTVWDLVKLADYLTKRDDIDPSKIGITGMSLGGIHAWFAAFVDTRYSVVVPIISVQGFRWAIDNDQWHARVSSIKSVFEEARIDLGKDAIDKEVVEKVWDRIAPGLASKFDSTHTLPLIAPRPLLILNGEQDSRCPMAGLNDTISRTQKAFEDAQCLDNFKVIVEDGIGHEMTSSMAKEASDWFDKFLKP
ncbi:hypothetical protein L2E82_11560 [Cichorium intybus]|uniref:Uncharacterized protein n=1 Tax=Cichorium intybus TaxID=13427 RepID=A0ACB9GED3_CICIN|nr:hypothetical protein L2E82_11560 [Cichorium intybus]